MTPTDKLISDLAKALKAEDAAASRYDSHPMDAARHAAWEKRKKTREGLERRILAAQENRDADLRSQGADEMRRRWRAGETALNGPQRPYFLQEVERYAADAKGDRPRKLREMFGDREAEFRIGIAQEAMALLRNLQPPTPRKETAAEARKSAKEAHEWVRARMGR